MKSLQAIKMLDVQEEKGRYIFSRHDLRKFFLDEPEKTFNEGVTRLVKSGILKRACRNVYVNEKSRYFDRYIIERIVKFLRRGKYNYVSLESILSEYGVISQIPIDRITVMTTGRKGIYKTLYGVIEFIHTSRSVRDILQNTMLIEGRPLRVASRDAALRDLKRVGRNTHLIVSSELDY